MQDVKMNAMCETTNTSPSTTNAQRLVSASQAIQPTATTARSTEQWASSANLRRSLA
ncbi:MAG: hypothetical protein ACT4O9_13985 [Blastocatellia bacterium]